MESKEREESEDTEDVYRELSRVHQQARAKAEKDRVHLRELEARVQTLEKQHKRTQKLLIRLLEMEGRRQGLVKVKE